MLNFKNCFSAPPQECFAFLQRRYIIEEDIRDYIDDGKVTLYYIGPDKENSILAQLGSEPGDFGIMSAKGDMPRVFLYLDPNERDRGEGVSVYEVEVLADDIYNIPADPDNLVQKWCVTSESVDDLYNSIKAAGYRGHYTSGRGFDCIEWYYPLAAKKAVLFT